MGAHMYADRCAGAIACGLFVFIRRPAGKLESEAPRSGSGGVGEQDSDSLGSSFSLRNVMGSFFFWIGLDSPPDWGGGGAAVAEPRRVPGAPGRPRLSAGPAVAPGPAVRSRPRWVGAPALHLMHSGCVAQPGAPAARSRSPSDAPACSPNARRLARPRTPRNAPTRGAAARPPAPRGARSLPRPGVTALGRRGRAGRPPLAFPSTATRCRAFVLPLRGGAGPPPRALAPASSLPVVPVSFAFPPS